jgi:hypothetical protein
VALADVPLGFGVEVEAAEAAASASAFSFAAAAFAAFAEGALGYTKSHIPYQNSFHFELKLNVMNQRD